MKVVHEEKMCCGGKRCPTIKIFEDGSVELTDDDTEIGSVGTIKLHPKHLDRIAELIATRK